MREREKSKLQCWESLSTCLRWRGCAGAEAGSWECKPGLPRGRQEPSEAVLQGPRWQDRAGMDGDAGVLIGVCFVLKKFFLVGRQSDRKRRARKPGSPVLVYCPDGCSDLGWARVGPEVRNSGYAKWVAGTQVPRTFQCFPRCTRRELDRKRSCWDSEQCWLGDAHVESRSTLPSPLLVF